MSANKKVAREYVLPVAQEIAGLLSMYCNRIAIAGSLRRERDSVSDIELVALPTIEYTRNLFGEITGSHNKLDYYLEKHTYPMIKNGKKYKQFRYAGYTVDLFLPESPDHWGCIYLIRTGSHDFNLWLMGERQHKAGVRFDKGRLWREGVALDTQEEGDVFRELGLPFIPPVHYRDDGRWIELLDKE
jgi:DNA polymerase/3'-5' exonuclease PolX